MEVIARQGDTLDRLVWERYGQRAGALEATLQANRGIADVGAVLPVGTRVSLPEIAPEPASTTVRLWD